jgi:hypothetical protein
MTPDEAITSRELQGYERRVRDEVGRTKILCDLLVETVTRFDPATIKPYQRPKTKGKRDPETMVILRSDGHPGLITPSYDLDVYHRRVELFTEKVVLIRDIISETIPIERCVIIDLGDNITGQGIFPNQSWKTQVHVMRQIYGEAAPALIKQGRTWLDYFPVVEEHSVPGNHGRTGKEYPDEVNFDNVLAQEIAARMDGVDRFSMEVEWDWWKYVNIYNWRFLAVHGSQIRGWMGIPFYGLTNKGMKWQGSMPAGPWHYLVHGHFHTPFSMPWNNFEIISNGALPSDDDFALRELGMASTPAQQVFGVHPEHGVTWRYTLDLT